MQYLKFSLVFDFFFHHLDLYQANKTFLKLTFTLFPYSLYFIDRSNN